MTSNVLGQPGGEAATVFRPVTGTRQRRGRALVGIASAAVAGFVVSAAWYAVWAEPYQQLRGATAAIAMPWWLLPAELGRSLVVAAVLTTAVRSLGISTLAAALKVAFLTWLAFPVVLLVGSILHEGVPPLLAAIHAGDWLVKLLVIAVVVRRFAGKAR